MFLVHRADESGAKCAVVPAQRRPATLRRWCGHRRSRMAIQCADVPPRVPVDVGHPGTSRRCLRAPARAAKPTHPCPLHGKLMLPTSPGPGPCAASQRRYPPRPTGDTGTRVAPHAPSLAKRLTLVERALYQGAPPRGAAAACVRGAQAHPRAPDRWRSSRGRPNGRRGPWRSRTPPRTCGTPVLADCRPSSPARAPGRGRGRARNPIWSCATITPGERASAGDHPAIQVHPETAGFLSARLSNALRKWRARRLHQDCRGRHAAEKKRPGNSRAANLGAVP